VIGLAAATRAHARLAWLRLRRGRALGSCLALFALPVVVSAALAAGGNWGRGLFDDLLEVYFRFLLPYLPALVAAPLIADELESRTAAFLFARPAPRAAMVVGRYAAACGPLALGAAASLLGAFLPTMMRFPGDLPGQLGHLARVEAAALLAVAAFGALGALAGTLFARHPYAAVVGYLLVVEGALGSAPVVLNLATVSWHVRNLAELPHAAALAVEVAPAVSALVTALGAALAVGAACLAVEDAEI
jgi:ABC-type transport system involved in multi-copper enzyme maturation permease subunit